MKFAVVDYETNGSFDIEDYVPIGVVVMNDNGSVDVRYTEEAEENSSPRYLAMMSHLERPREQADKDGVAVDWPEVFGRLVNQSYLGLKFRIGAMIPTEMTADEAFEKFVTNRETPEDIPVSDEGVPSGY
jgi:hypothetical protein